MRDVPVLALRDQNIDLPQLRDDLFRRRARASIKKKSPSLLISTGLGHARLLRTRSERPRSSRAAEQHDEVAPFHHSITSSARASKVGGTVSPSTFAVRRLMTSSNLIGACTGRSAGCSPLRMRST